MNADPEDSRKKAFPLRLDARLYAELRRWADAELRSMNGQIEFILRRALAERRRALGSDADAAPEDRQA
jgi:hypothetical protein